MAPSAKWDKSKPLVLSQRLSIGTQLHPTPPFLPLHASDCDLDHLGESWSCDSEARRRSESEGGCMSGDGRVWSSKVPPKVGRAATASGVSSDPVDDAVKCDAARWCSDRRSCANTLHACLVSKYCQNWFSSRLDGGQFTVEDYQRQGASATAMHSRLHPSLDQNSVSTLPPTPTTSYLTTREQ